MADVKQRNYFWIEKREISNRNRLSERVQDIISN